MGFSLSEIEEILLIKKSGNEPCNFVSDKIKEKISLIEEHIEELLRKKEELLEHLQTGEKVCGWHGDVCHYIEGIDENSKDQLIIENLDSHNNLNI